MLIPKGGSAPTASTYMNFVYDPKIAAQIALGVSYVCPVKGAEKSAAKINPEIAKNPLVFPTDETLAQTAPERPDGTVQRRLQTKGRWLGGDGPSSLYTMGAVFHRHKRGSRRTCCSRRGWSGSAVFFLVAARLPRLPVAPDGRSFGLGYEFNWACHNFSDAIRTTTRS